MSGATVSEPEESGEKLCARRGTEVRAGEEETAAVMTPTALTLLMLQ
jgi:hypothetical protein